MALSDVIAQIEQAFSDRPEIAAEWVARAKAAGTAAGASRVLQSALRAAPGATTALARTGGQLAKVGVAGGGRMLPWLGAAWIASDLIRGQVGSYAERKQVELAKKEAAQRSLANAIIARQMTNSQAVDRAEAAARENRAFLLAQRGQDMENNTARLALLKDMAMGRTSGAIESQTPAMLPGAYDLAQGDVDRLSQIGAGQSANVLARLGIN